MKYNSHGQQQTGFDNSIDHSFYGHWSNQEYQQLCQDAERNEREQQEQQEQQEQHHETSLELPF